MRLSEPIIKKGKFWLPEKDTESILGTLNVSHKGEVWLDLEGRFHDFTENISKIKSICGITYDCKELMLKNCFYIEGTHYKLGTINSKIHVDLMIDGICLGLDEELEISKLTFQFDNMSRWLGLSGFKEVTSYHKEKNVPIILEWDYPDDYKITLKDDIELSFKFGWSQSIRPSPILGNKEFRISEEPYLELEFINNISIDKASEYVDKLVKFFCFATDDALSLKNLCVFHNNKRLNIYKESKPYIDKISAKNYSQMFFSFSDVKDNLGNILNEWLVGCKDFSESLSLYFAVQIGAYDYSEAQFLAMAQTLEAFHRRTCPDTKHTKKEFKKIKTLILKECPEEYKKSVLDALSHAHELNLGDRLEKLIQPFENLQNESGKMWVKDKNDLIEKIKKTRNHFTHYEKKEQPISNTELVYLTEKLKGVFQINLLKYLGFSNNEIEKIYNNFNNNLQHRLCYSAYENEK